MQHISTPAWRCRWAPSHKARGQDLAARRIFVGEVLSGGSWDNDAAQPVPIMSKAHQRPRRMAQGRWVLLTSPGLACATFHHE